MRLRRTLCAVLASLLGTALLVVHAPAAAPPHAGIFQSRADATALGIFYTRPGQLPVGDDILAASFGYARSQVSLLQSLGLGSYLWFGDLASGYKEAIVIGAEQAPQNF